MQISWRVLYFVDLEGQISWRVLYFVLGPIFSGSLGEPNLNNYKQLQQTQERTIGGWWLVVGGGWLVVGAKCCACHASLTGAAAATQERQRENPTPSSCACRANHAGAAAATQEHQGVRPWQLVGGSLLVAISWWQLVGGSLLVAISWWQLVGGNWLVEVCRWQLIGGKREAGGGGGGRRSGYHTKNKSPTRQCGELHPKSIMLVV